MVRLFIYYRMDGLTLCEEVTFFRISFCLSNFQRYTAASFLSLLYALVILRSTALGVTFI